MRQAILEAVRIWHADPRTTVVSQFSQAREVKMRLQQAAEHRPTSGQMPVATRSDVGLSARPHEAPPLVRTPTPPPAVSR